MNNKLAFFSLATLFLFSFASAGETNVADGLIFHAKGNDIIDYSPYTHNIINTNVNVISDFSMGSVYDFDGTSYMQIDGLSSDINEKNITYSFWMNYSGGGYPFGCANGVNPEMQMQIVGGTDIWHKMGVTGGILGANAITPNNWYLVTVTFEDVVTTDWTNLYINGEYFSRTGGTGTIPYTDNCWFGRTYYTSGYLVGQMKDIRVYDRALSPDEIMLLYTNPYLPDPLPPAYESTLLYQVIRSSGAGLGMFFQMLAIAFPMLIIGLAFVGVIVVLGWQIHAIVIHFSGGHNEK